ncbi:DUF397 domain-containing protein [Streptomyces bauhiniae]|uniref:DUF397 domain-containing protein n=1 Tax=Streptomyces bauhiniae TaxID=2340725 RepID=A0A7K3QZM3_9ACTN|nr:DUF397 domain-containing protein [Streptomyces bauhiniae]NEB95333.1 DUF397 domain-containing protein [Streptomyces bauhiniae]
MSREPELAWLKSSYSSGTDGESCVEIAHTSWVTCVGQPPELHWFKSSHSSGNDGNSCVEIARAPRTVHVRDSKRQAGPRLALTQDTWTVFLTGVRD